jgi:hypothetical protein
MQNRGRQPREAGQLELLTAATLEFLALSSCIQICVGFILC